MKISINLLTIALTCLTHTSFSQNLNVQQHWVGALKQGGADVFKMELDLKQNNTTISGTAKYSYAEYGRIAYVLFTVSGSVNGSTFNLLDETVLDQRGSITDWCKKSYTGTINTQNGVVTSITGSWRNDGNKVFENKILQSGGSCTPGQFTVSVNGQNAGAQPQSNGSSNALAGIGNVNGDWEGTLEEPNMFNYLVKANLTQAGSNITGTLEVEQTDRYVKLKISGRLEGPDLVFHTDSLLEGRGTNQFKQLDFRGTPFIFNSSTSENIATRLPPELRSRLNVADGAAGFSGSASQSKSDLNEPLDFVGKGVRPTRFGSMPVKFVLTKVDAAKKAATLAKACVSGNCIDGWGVKVTSEGRYAGYFKNGEEDGQGTWDYYGGLYAGNRYIGQFSHNAFNGQGVLYNVIPKEKISNNPADRTAFYITDSTGAKLEKIYEGGWLQNYPRGLGKKYTGGMPQLAAWSGWYKTDNNNPLQDVFMHHFDTTFAHFTKCDCLTAGEITMIGSRMKTYSYDMVDAYGRYIETKTESTPEDITYTAKGFINKTNHIVYVKEYRKYFDDKNKECWVDESFAVLPGKSIYNNYRPIPPPTTAISLWEEESKNVIYLGQYMFKDDVKSATAPKKK